LVKKTSAKKGANGKVDAKGKGKAVRDSSTNGSKKSVKKEDGHGDEDEKPLKKKGKKVPKVEELVEIKSEKKKAKKESE
jgi:hypothetical protein